MKNFLVALLVVLSVGCGQATNQASDDLVADHVVVILDNSGSMSEYMSDSKTPKMDAAKQSLVKVLSLLPKTAHVGILLLNTGWWGSGGDNWLVPIGPINMENITQKVQGVDNGGGTPLGARLKDGADALLAIRDKTHYGSYRLLVVTDGQATDPEVMDKNFEDILSRGLTVDVIGVMMEGEHQLAKRSHSYRSADDPASLERAIKEVLAETPASKDSSQEDFELAAAIPEGMTLQIIKALCASTNHPIGEVKPAVVNKDGTVPVDQSGKVVPKPTSSGWSPGAIALMVIGGILGVILLIALLCALLDN